MKSPREVLDSEFATQNLTGMVRDGVVRAMEDYASLWRNAFKELSLSHIQQANKLKDQETLLNNLEGRANALEEWLTEYRDELKDNDTRHNKQSIINAINELLNENSTDI